jgi:serine/threonine protein kinase
MFKPYNKAEITFDLITEIGQAGRNSRTFVSMDHQLDAEIVVKQIPKAKIASTANFFDESKALYASAHPNVVQIHYACEDTDSVYLAMPYYRKGSVTGLITGKNMRSAKSSLSDVRFSAGSIIFIQRGLFTSM